MISYGRTPVTRNSVHTAPKTAAASPAPVVTPGATPSAIPPVTPAYRPKPVAPAAPVKTAPATIPATASAPAQSLRGVFNTELGPVIETLRARPQAFVVSTRHTDDPAQPDQPIGLYVLHTATRREWRLEVEKTAKDVFAIKTDGHTANMPGAYLPHVFARLREDLRKAAGGAALTP